MRQKNPDPELQRVVDVPLEARIRGLQAELESYVEQCALDIKRGADGLPVEVIIAMLRGRTGACQCATALKVIADQKKDAEIAERQQKGAA